MATPGGAILQPTRPRVPGKLVVIAIRLYFPVLLKFSPVSTKILVQSLAQVMVFMIVGNGVSDEIGVCPDLHVGLFICSIRDIIVFVGASYLIYLCRRCH